MCLMYFWIGSKVFMTCKLLQLESNTRDYDWILHPNSSFIPFCYEKVKVVNG